MSSNALRSLLRGGALSRRLRLPDSHFAQQPSPPRAWLAPIGDVAMLPKTVPRRSDEGRHV
jgi:hypothetical protein